MIPGARQRDVIRFDGQTRGSDGRASATTSTVQITAAVQPADGATLDRLPSGYRDRESVLILSYDEIRTVNDVGKKKADLLEHDGKQFRIHTSKKFTDGVPHWDAVAVKVKE